MRIIDACGGSTAMSSPIRQTFIDFARMTVSLVASVLPPTAVAMTGQDIRIRGGALS
jgi:hypothetical protein